MSDDGSTPDAELPDVDSGPFCRHYHSPIDCQEICDRCCHRCPRHYEDLGCDALYCDCPGWVEAPPKTAA